MFINVYRTGGRSMRPSIVYVGPDVSTDERLFLEVLTEGLANSREQRPEHLALSRVVKLVIRGYGS